MKPYLKTWSNEPIVTTLPSNLPHIKQDPAFENYPLTRIVYALEDGYTLKTIERHLRTFPHAELLGFGKSKDGNPYVLNNQEIRDIVTFYQTQSNKSYITPNGTPLRSYQNEMVTFALENNRCGLFVDMGLGKTLSTLEVINQLIKADRLATNKAILIIAPKIVALDTWSRESSKWGYDWEVLVNIGLTPKKRNELLDKAKPGNFEKPTLLTTNPDQLNAILSYFRKNQVYRPFDMIIVDELSMFKNATTKRFDYLSKLSKSVPYFIGLTGTPAPNGLIDLWGQTVSINPKVMKDLGYNFFQYRSKFFEPDIVDPRSGTVYSWKPVHGAQDAVYKAIKPFVISMRTNGRIVLPEVTYVNEYVTMNARAKETYKEWDTKVRKEFKDQDRVNLDVKGQNVEVANTATLTSKLLQLSTGAVYDNLLVNEETGVGSYQVFHDEKLKRLKEMIETATTPYLVFYQFKSDVERAMKFFEFELLDTKDPNISDVISRWNKGKIPVLFAHPASAGHGLNLQDGGHTIIWLTPTWSNEQYRQANKRLHRSGQKYPVQIIHLITEGTVDADVIQRLTIKEEGQQHTMSALERK